MEATTSTPVSSGSAMRAYRNAMNMLIELHQEQFDRIYGDFREDAGLPRVAGPRKPTVEEKIAKLEAKIALLREQAF